MAIKTYKKGVYLLTDKKDSVVIFDGKDWLIPGWECYMRLSNWNGDTVLDESTIGDLIYEFKD